MHGGTAADCPDPEVVGALALGEDVADDVVADVAAHIEDCEQCAGLFHDIAGDDDTEGDEGGACPSAAMLAAYQRGELDRTSEKLVIKHLEAGCERCLEAVLELS